MTERIRTLLAVAVLTATIWVWADLEQTDEATLTVPVRVVVPSAFIVRPGSISPNPVRVKIKGPRGEIRRLKEDPTAKECRFELADPNLKTGPLALRPLDGFKHWDDHRVDVLEVLAENDRAAGEVTCDLDRYVRETVPVEVRVFGAMPKASAARPADVVAVVLESRLRDLPPARRKAIAPITITTFPEDKQVQREVPLESRLGGADGIEAIFEPPIVTVTVSLEPFIAKTLAPVPILIAGPPEMLNAYQVVFQEDTPRQVELKVEGPPQAVMNLTERQVRLELVLAPEDRPAEEGTWIPRVPQVTGLPPNVRLAGPLPTVNFNLKRLGAETRPP